MRYCDKRLEKPFSKDTDEFGFSNPLIEERET